MFILVCGKCLRVRSGPVCVCAHYKYAFVIEFESRLLVGSLQVTVCVDNVIFFSIRKLPERK